MTDLIKSLYSNLDIVQKCSCSKYFIYDSNQPLKDGDILVNIF